MKELNLNSCHATAVTALAERDSARWSAQQAISRDGPPFLLTASLLAPGNGVPYDSSEVVPDFGCRLPPHRSASPEQAIRRQRGALSGSWHRHHTEPRPGRLRTPRASRDRRYQGLSSVRLAGI